MCEYCNDTGEVEMDNNGPIGPCPVCAAVESGDLNKLHTAVDEMIVRTQEDIVSAMVASMNNGKAETVLLLGRRTTQAIRQNEVEWWAEISIKDAAMEQIREQPYF